MADMTAMADVLNGDPADATDVQSNFQIIEAYINGSELVRADGTVAMTASLDMGGFGFTNVSLSNVVPSGTVWDYAGNTVPTGWLLCDGSTVSRTTYANLFAAIGTLWNTGGEAGTDFRLPDGGGKVAVGFGASPFNVVGNTGGQADPSLVEHNHTGPSHTHTFSATSGNESVTHTHSVDPPSTTSTSDAHDHSYTSATVTYNAAAGGAPVSSTPGVLTTTSDSHTHAVNISAFDSANASVSHTHSVSGTTDAGGTGNTGNAGTATVTNHNYSPYGVYKKIIKT